LCAFAENTSLKLTYKAELCGITRAIEIVVGKNWCNIWLETNSTLLVMAFKSYVLVSWDLGNRWLYCIRITKSMTFVVTHVCMERNQCVDKLANICLTIVNFTIWHDIPSQLVGIFYDNRLEKPSFKFVIS
jgi:hypothetical protein